MILKQCNQCGRCFLTNRSHARYCSNKCRVKALRARQAASKASGLPDSPEGEKATSTPRSRLDGIKDTD